MMWNKEFTKTRLLITCFDHKMLKLHVWNIVCLLGVIFCHVGSCTGNQLLTTCKGNILSSPISTWQNFVFHGDLFYFKLLGNFPSETIFEMTIDTSFLINRLLQVKFPEIDEEDKESGNWLLLFFLRYNAFLTLWDIDNNFPIIHFTWAISCQPCCFKVITSWETVYLAQLYEQKGGNGEEELPKKPVGRQSDDCWSSVGRQTANRFCPKYRPTVGRQLVMCR